MLSAHIILSPCDWSHKEAADSITLDHDARHRRRISLTSDGGTVFLLNLPRAIMLLHGDAIQLEDGRLIRVVAADEPLMHVAAGAAVSLPRLAWHVGNRHLPAVIHDDHLLLRQDHVIADMLQGLGATVTQVMAPFTPEQGAYSGGHNAAGHDSTEQDGQAGAHHHDHDHAHTHDHDHGARHIHHHDGHDPIDHHHTAAREGHHHAD